MKNIIILLCILLMQSISIQDTNQNLFFWYRNNPDGFLVDQFPQINIGNNINLPYDSDFLVNLNLEENTSTGRFQVNTENGNINNITDNLNYIGDIEDDLIIKVFSNNDKIIITYLFGENEFIWDIVDITDYFLGINFKLMEIKVNDFIGDIKVYNNTGYGLRLKITEVTGFTQGYQINKNNNKKYVFINGKWKQKNL